MSDAYAKVFESLFDGSLRGNSDAILVWVNILTHMRGDISDIHFKKIADETGLTSDRVKQACSFLERPDPESRSQEEEGRRMIRLDDHREWGWRVVNAWKYRFKGGQDDKTKQLTRQRVAKYREKTGGGVTLGNVTETLPSGSASGSVPVSDQGRGVGEVQTEPKIPWSWVLKWLEASNKGGSDYTEKETRTAYLSLEANGWMWGKNSVVDWRSALECKIQDNRGRRSPNGHASKTEAFKEFGTKEQSEALKKAELAEIARLTAQQRKVT